MAAKDSISETVRNHKKGAPWLKEDLEKALSDFGLTLDQEYTGRIIDKHWVIFANGDRRQVLLYSVLSGNTKGNGVLQYTTERINEKLRQRGAVLAEDYKGNIRKKHLVKFSNGLIKSVFLHSVFSGDSLGKREVLKHNENTVNEKLAERGARLAENFKGSVDLYHLVEFSNGNTMNVVLKCALYGNSNGERGRHSTQSVNKILSKQGSILTEEFTGNSNQKHLVKFKCGHIHKVTLADPLRGSGCPQCATSGFKLDKPAYLYFLQVKIQEIYVYKIGVTNNNIKRRYANERADYKIIGLFEATGKNTVAAEKEILQTFQEYKYEGESPFRFTTNKEILTKNVCNHPLVLEILKLHEIQEVDDSTYKLNSKIQRSSEAA